MYRRVGVRVLFLSLSLSLSLSRNCSILASFHPFSASIRTLFRWTTIFLKASLSCQSCFPISHRNSPLIATTSGKTDDSGSFLVVLVSHFHHRHIVLRYRFTKSPPVFSSSHFSKPKFSRFSRHGDPIACIRFINVFVCVRTCRCVRACVCVRVYGVSTCPRTVLVFSRRGDSDIADVCVRRPV